MNMYDSDTKPEGMLAYIVPGKLTKYNVRHILSLPSLGHIGHIVVADFPPEKYQ